MQGATTCDSPVRVRNRATLEHERERQVRFWIDRGICRELDTNPAEFLESVPPLAIEEVEVGCDRYTLPALLVVPMSIADFCEWRGIKSWKEKPIGAMGPRKSDPYWVYFATTTRKRNGAKTLQAIELLFFVSHLRLPANRRILSGTSWGNGELLAYRPPQEDGRTRGWILPGSLNNLDEPTMVGDEWSLAVSSR